MPAFLFSQMKKQDPVELFSLKNSDRFYNTDKMLHNMTCLSKAQAFMKSQNLKICVASGSKPSQ